MSKTGEQLKGGRTKMLFLDIISVGLCGVLIVIVVVEAICGVLIVIAVVEANWAASMGWGCALILLGRIFAGIR